MTRGGFTHYVYFMGSNVLAEGIRVRGHGSDKEERQQLCNSAQPNGDAPTVYRKTFSSVWKKVHMNGHVPGSLIWLRFAWCSEWPTVWLLGMSHNAFINKPWAFVVTDMWFVHSAELTLKQDLKTFRKFKYMSENVPSWYHRIGHPFCWL